MKAVRRATRESETRNLETYLDTDSTQTQHLNTAFIRFLLDLFTEMLKRVENLLIATYMIVYVVYIYVYIYNIYYSSQVP